MSPLDELRNALIANTIAHARNAPFYARVLESLDATNVEGLSALPLLDKTTAVAAQEQMRCGDAPFDFGSTSSGTTRIGNELLRVERSPAELDALAELQEMLHGGAPDPDAQPPLVLHVVTPHHGLPSGAPPANEMRIAWASSSNVIDMITRALLEERGGQRIEVIRISVASLKQLTCALLERGFDFSQLQVRWLGTNAALVTSRWRRVLQETWGATVVDNYSLSEITTPATECESCGAYHFAMPPLVFEVLDAWTHEPLYRSGAGGDDTATGELVLTTLYPYVQRQPLLRYRTGDIVTLTGYCEEADDLGLRFRGRTGQTLREDGVYLLFPSLLEDIADDYAEVMRHPHPLEVLGELRPQQVGQPKVRAHMEGPAVVVEIGLTFAPELYKEKSARLHREIEDRICGAHPSLDRSRLRLKLVDAPGDKDWAQWFVKYG